MHNDTPLLLKLAVPILLLFPPAPVAAAPTPPAPRRAGGTAPADQSLVVNLRDFGAAGDGATDDGPALQAALDALADAGGGTLFVPAGRYALVSPVAKDFAGLASPVTIRGVGSDATVAPPAADGQDLAAGLALTSEFFPRTGEGQAAVSLSRLRSFLIEDVAFVGTPGVFTDAAVTLSLRDVEEAAIRHCEFYGLSSYAPGGGVVLNVRGDLKIERTVFLGCVGSSAYENSVVQNLEWKGLTVANTIFLDYGLRPDLFGKLDYDASFSWIGIGNAAATNDREPRREVVVRDVFLDEGVLSGISCRPEFYEPPSAPIDLIHISGLRMNVTNLGWPGHLLSNLRGALVENSYYGWSQNTDSAISLNGVGTAILDRVETAASATRIRADAATGRLTVIDSVYSDLASLARATEVINTTAPDEGPVRYVRRQFRDALRREPDAAAHFYWSDRLLRCRDAGQCASERAALGAYLAAGPPPSFSVTGRVTGEGGMPVADAAVTLSGSQSVTTRTDADGRYTFRGLPTSGSYAVTAAKPHYTFAPAAAAFADVPGDRVADFRAGPARHAISGRVTIGGAGVGGVTVALDGTHPLAGQSSARAVTDANGAYSFDALAGGNYTVAPSGEEYSFGPAAVFVDLSDSRVANFSGTLRAVIEFESTDLRAAEGAGTVGVSVRRRGDTGRAETVVFRGEDGTARQGRDLGTVIGRVVFGPGETSKSFDLHVTDDSLPEADEQLAVVLRAGGGAFVGPPLTLTITDDDNAAAGANPVDDARFFVRQQYLDFLNRGPDAAGLQFWENEITRCGADAGCAAAARVNTSAAFFLSIEFQETGYLVYRAYRAAYGRAPRRVEEFLYDTRLIGEGVVVGEVGWGQRLAANREAFFADFVSRPDFAARHPDDLTPAQFVAALDEATGGALSPGERAAAAAEFGGAADSADRDARRRALGHVVAGAEFSRREFNRAFVLMQYFGYLQRGPEEAPDSNLDGYNFWLAQLERHGGDFRRAEMVRAFIESLEYRGRYGN